MELIGCVRRDASGADGRSGESDRALLDTLPFTPTRAQLRATTRSAPALRERIR